MVVCSTAEAAECWRSLYLQAHGKAREALGLGMTREGLRGHMLNGFNVGFDAMEQETIASIVGRAVDDVLGDRPATSPFLLDRA